MYKPEVGPANQESDIVPVKLLDVPLTFFVVWDVILEPATEVEPAPKSERVSPDDITTLGAPLPLKTVSEGELPPVNDILFWPVSGENISLEPIPHPPITPSFALIEPEIVAFVADITPSAVTENKDDDISAAASWPENVPFSANTEPVNIKLLPSHAKFFDELPIENLYAPPVYPKKKPVPVLNAVCPPFMLPPLDNVIPPPVIVVI